MDVPTPQVRSLTLNADRGPELNAVAIVFICISFTTILCRGFSRLYTEVKFGLDDWLIVLAAVMFLDPLPLLEIDVASYSHGHSQRSG